MGAGEREESLFSWEVPPARGSPAQWAETLRHKLMRRRGADAEEAGEDEEGASSRAARALREGDTALPKARVLSQLPAAPVWQGGCSAAALSLPLPGCPAPGQTISSQASRSCKGFCWAEAKICRAPQQSLTIAMYFTWALQAPQLNGEILAGQTVV